VVGALGLLWWRLGMPGWRRGSEDAAS
jgi:hypothetical protein